MRSQNVKKLLVPRENAREAAVVQEVETYAVTSLAEAVGIISGAVDVDPVSPPSEEIETKLNRYDVDFSDVRGQEFAKRAIAEEIDEQYRAAIELFEKYEAEQVVNGPIPFPS